MRVLKFKVGKKSVRLPLAVAIAGFVIVLAGGGAAARLGGIGRNAAGGDIELQKGLVGWWKMDGNAKDATPISNNGSVTSASLTTDRKARSNSAYSFNGSTSFIDVPDNSNYNSTTGTWSTWFKINNVPGGNSSILLAKHSGTGSNGGISIRLVSTGVIAAQFKTTGGSSANLTGTTAYNDSAWHLVVLTFAGNGTANLYVDGNTEASGSPPSGWSFTASSTFRLGKSPDSFWNVYDGSLDDARIYNRVITSAERSALFKSSGSGISTAVGQKSLVAQWKMDGNAKDATPNANNGTVTSATLTTDRKAASNSAYSFNGSTANIEVPDNSKYNSTTGTWMTWFKVTSSPASTAAVILGKHSATSSNGGISLLLNSTGHLYVQTKTTGGASTDISATTAAYDDGSWHHVALTFTGNSNMHIYVDGVDVRNGAPQSGWSFAASSVFRMGKSVDSFWAAYNGLLDDTRIYNRVLTTTEIAAIAGSYNSQVSVSSLQSGLVGSWGLNGNAKDATPYADNGTVTSATLTTDRKARSNSAYSFNGSTSYIDIVDNSVYRPTTGTWVLWTKLTSAPGSVTSAIMSKHSSSSSVNGIIIGATTSGTISGQVKNGSSSQSVTCTSCTINDSNWHMVALTFTPTQAQYYFDGVASTATSLATVSGWTFDTSSLRLGKSVDSFWSLYNGSIDDVRIYKRVLTSTEIQALYKEY